MFRKANTTRASSDQAFRQVPPIPPINNPPQGKASASVLLGFIASLCFSITGCSGSPAPGSNPAGTGEAKSAASAKATLDPAQKKAQEELAALNAPLNATDQYRLSAEDIALLENEGVVSSDESQALKTHSE